jgi:hypothetical protein
MTTYSRTITLNDGEAIAVEAALRLMIERCDHECKNGPRAPFFAHRQSCLEVLEQLMNAPLSQTSFYIQPRR